MENIHRFIILLVSGTSLFLCLPAALQAQTEPWQEEFILLRARIQELEQAEQRGDSLDNLYTRLLDLLEENDRLGAFLDAAWDWQANYFYQSEYASSLLEEVLSCIWRKPKNEAEWESLMWVHINHGYHLFQSGRVLEAVKAYEKAEQIQEQYHFEHFPAADYLYLPLGAHYTRLGDNEKARAVYLKALQDLSAEKEAAVLAGIYNNIGITYWNAGNNEEAVRWYRKGLALPHLPKGKRGLLLSALAQSLAELNRPDEALKSADEAIHYLRRWYAETKDDPHIAAQLAGAHTRKAELLSKKYPDEALREFDNALSYSYLAYPSGYHREIAKVYIKRGQSYLQQKKNKKALKDFDAALQSLLPGFQAAGNGQSLPDSSRLYAENALFEALEGKADALSTLPDEDLAKLESALHAHQLADLVQNLLYQSYRYSSSKLLLQEQGRKRSEKAIALCFRLFQKTKQEKYIHKAFQIAEQYKARLLRESLHENLLRSLAADNQLFKTKTELQKQLAYIERQTLSQPEGQEDLNLRQQHDRIVEALYQTERDIAQKYPRYANSLNRLSASLQDVKKQLPGKTGFLSCFFGKDKLYTWALLPSGKYCFNEISLRNQTLPDEMQRLFRLLSQHDRLAENRTAFGRLAHSIYLQLYPAELCEAPPPHMLIIPDGPLYYLPFDALLTEEADTNTNWQAWPFLLKKQQIQYAYSATVWLEQAAMQKPMSDERLLVIPAFPEDARALPPLSQGPHLSEMVGEKHLLSNYKATLSAFRQMAPRHSLIHLHTHALSEDNPRIELSDSSLFLPDIYALPLHAQLVILSACQTGSGKVVEGEGAMSLARAFSYAGTRNLIASLWKVNEKSTARLFENFYRHLQKGKSPGEALHRAKLDYLKDSQVENWEKSPYYWAAFVSIGYDEQASGSWMWWVLGGALVVVLGGGALKCVVRRAH